MWECRLCGSQNDRTNLRCGVCGKGVFPEDAYVASAPTPAAPVGKRGIGAVIVPGAPGSPLPPPGAKDPPGAKPLPAATHATAAASTGRKGARTALIVVVLLLILVAVAIGIAIVAGVAVPWSGPGASSLSMLGLPAVARRRPGSGRSGPSRR